MKLFADNYQDMLIKANDLNYIVYTQMLSMSIIYNDVMKEQMKNAMS